jgi:hypothetical protein
MNEAWADSHPGDRAHRHEEGGWVYVNPATGEVTTRRAKAGVEQHIDLDDPPTVPGSVVVASFHTHPTPAAEGGDPGPSGPDATLANRRGVPNLIRNEDGTDWIGPDSRDGGLGGRPGYPGH